MNGGKASLVASAEDEQVDLEDRGLGDGDVSLQRIGGGDFPSTPRLSTELVRPNRPKTTPNV